jgi:type II secretory pathway component PulJ
MTARRTELVRGRREGGLRLAGTRQQGTSLPEMLVSCALLSLLLLLATGMHAEARKVSALAEEVALRGQIVELAGELLRYHLGLAGHGGLSATASAPTGPALELARGSAAGGSDALTVRYVEERWYLEPEERVLTFDVKRDSNGLWNLYQRDEGATRQPAVQHVEDLRVAGFLAPDGALLPRDAPLPLDAVALELELGFSWGDRRRVMVSFPGPRQVVAGW